MLLDRRFRLIRQMTNLCPIPQRQRCWKSGEFVHCQRVWGRPVRLYLSDGHWRFLRLRNPYIGAPPPT